MTNIERRIDKLEATLPARYDAQDRAFLRRLTTDELRELRGVLLAVQADPSEENTARYLTMRDELRRRYA
ncbi:MAG: hypothetical protein K8G79_12700 [bacterium]|uniref:Uncharacterized protein n=1 Tax=Candidatus Methylomirabilis tolerans TaxID=3123416 RepID=A0AAJ1AJQ7_9BACT|nr:hypothetical protein [Candidatus Methylomirabilis sp.]